MRVQVGVKLGVVGAVVVAGLVLSALPASAAFLAHDLVVTSKGVTTGEDAFDGGGISNAQKVVVKVKKRAAFTVCVQNQPGSGGPSPSDFFVKGQGDQKGWKATWKDEALVLVPDADMVAGNDGPYSLLSGEDACFTLKIARTLTAARRATWRLIGNTSGGIDDDGDHVSIVIRRKGP